MVWTFFCTDVFYTNFPEVKTNLTLETMHKVGNANDHLIVWSPGYQRVLFPLLGWLLITDKAETLSLAAWYSNSRNSLLYGHTQIVKKWKFSWSSLSLFRKVLDSWANQSMAKNLTPEFQSWACFKVLWHGKDWMYSGTFMHL